MAAPASSRRLMKDVERAQQKEMRDQGIYYTTVDEKIDKGLALIEGPENTPYEGCFLLFSFQFPYDYPFSPPKVSFLTTDRKTRFHPNLYVDGKVCLSILGTFSGPTWSATQSLSTILLSLLALLDNNPLSHEPSFEKGTLLDYKHKQYADCVEHNIVKLMVDSIFFFEKSKYPLWEPFQEEIQERLPFVKEKLKKKILARAEQPETMWANLVYAMNSRSFWKTMVKDVEWIKN